MNVHARVPAKRIDANVTTRELLAFESATRDFDIAEGALGRPELQIRLRELIEAIFAHLPRAACAASLSDPSSLIPDYCVITGLRLHELPYAPERDVRGAFVVGLSSFWGEPELGNYHQPDSRFAYRHIKARPLAAGEPESLLNSIRDGFPHTDSAFKKEPEPLFALFVVRAACDGGDSLVWNVRALLEWIATQPSGSEAVTIMRERPFPFIGSVLDPAKVIRAPILMDGSGMRMRYKRDAIEDAAKALGRPLASEERLVMELIEAAAEVPELIERFALADGDAVILDNHRTLHSRTPFRDVCRHLLKTTMMHRGQ